MSRRAAKKDLTRSQILSAATDLFAQQGYENTAIDEITEKADVAKGTFYYHFGSKEDVVIALRNDSFMNTNDNAMHSLNKGYSPIRVIEQVLMERAAWTEQNPELAKVFFEQRIHHFLFRENDVFMFPEPAVHSNVELSTKVHNGTRVKVRFFQLIYELVLAGQKTNELRRDIDPRELAQIILATFIHAQGSWLGGYSGISLIDKVHRWFHAILDGLYDQSFQSEEIATGNN
jgi:AcrR family transcriptional regulator